jgi:beta-lactamase regulating signal transducer with metallopeptidase domain
MITWMLYCVVIGALLALAARAAEGIVRVMRLPMRWIWAVAITLTVVLASLAPFRRSADVTRASDSSAAISITDVVALQASIDAASRRLPSAATIAAVSTWLIASLVLVFAMVGVHLRVRRARRGWPLTDLHGHRVRVSPEIGPIVLGLNRPEIVVPRWLLTRSNQDQRLAVTHEAEHIRARDTWLLAAGCIVVALLPWNPASWYMFARLRLAVELDCDARVLRRGVALESYGELLLDVAAHASPLRFGAAALTNGAYQLHQRILAMKNRAPKFARMRAGAAALVVVAAVVVACETKVPTAVDETHRAAPSEAAVVEVLRPVVDAREEPIATRPHGPEAPAEYNDPREFRAGPVRRRATSPGDILLVTRSGISVNANARIVDTESPLTERQAPLMIIDGVRTSGDAFKKIDPKDIERVEVVKGAAAIKEYGEDAKRGVIVVVTKRPK